jgi:hypothetical protein
MLEQLIWATGLLCGGALLAAWQKYGDVFHPLILVCPMFAFMYVYMPKKLIDEGQLYTYVTAEQSEFTQVLVLLELTAFICGCFSGSSVAPRPHWFVPMHFDQKRIQRGAYILGGLGFAAWFYAIGNSGGIANVFGQAKGIGWSDIGYIREAAYLMIVGLLLLFSPSGFEPKKRIWQAAVVLFAFPYLIQGLLGAQRGPTFLVATTLGLSWYFARGKRPPFVLLLTGGALLGGLMLFLVANRGAIYIGSDQELKADVAEMFKANEANEYIFGTGCITASRQTGRYFWGRRYLAQVLVRPIPRQIWPTKYADFGIPEIEQNAGVAGAGLDTIMGWGEIPGAAAGMVADVWVELSWLAIPFLGVIGWGYGYAWRRAILQGGPWITLYTIFCLLSVYFISQSGEAVIFRFVILSIPALYVWRLARIEQPTEVDRTVLPDLNHAAF